MTTSFFKTYYPGILLPVTGSRTLPQRGEATDAGHVLHGGHRTPARETHARDGAVRGTVPLGAGRVRPRHAGEA